MGNDFRDLMASAVRTLERLELQRSLALALCKHDSEELDYQKLQEAVDKARIAGVQSPEFDMAKAFLAEVCQKAPTNQREKLLAELAEAMKFSDTGCIGNATNIVVDNYMQAPELTTARQLLARMTVGTTHDAENLAQVLSAASRCGLENEQTAFASILLVEMAARDMLSAAIASEDQAALVEAIAQARSVLSERNKLQQPHEIWQDVFEQETGGAGNAATVSSSPMVKRSALRQRQLTRKGSFTMIAGTDVFGAAQPNQQPDVAPMTVTFTQISGKMELWARRRRSL
jgi:hypothetical protein